MTSTNLLFQEPATQVMESLIDFHHELMFYLWIIFGFVVMCLLQIVLAYCPKTDYLMFNAVWTHRTKLEIIWTTVPIYILLIIGGPSFSLLYSMEELVDPALTIHAIGRQWYWRYEYGDVLFFDSLNDNLAFDSFMVPDSDTKLRLLEVTREVVLPMHVQIRLLTTASDVLHSWTIPAFGIKLDACPGRINQTTLLLKRTGIFYGQCSEICGINHAFMPIAVRSVPPQEFLSWFSNNVGGMGVGDLLELRSLLTTLLFIKINELEGLANLTPTEDILVVNQIERLIKINELEGLANATPTEDILVVNQIERLIKINELSKG